MRSINPVENTGIVKRRSDGTFLGSCFIFRYTHTIITAHHVIRDYQPEELVIEFPASRAQRQGFAARRSQRHPTADLAVLEIDPPNERDITWPFTEAWDDRAFGLDVISFGYPQEWDEGTSAPMARLFKGHVQRFFNHTSHLGYKYFAAELSFGCPGGLSGSFILNSNLWGRLYGVVTENKKTTTELESVLEVDDKGQIYKENFHNIINYGLALWLPSCTDWLDQIVPPVPPEEIDRRGQNQHKLAAEESLKA